MKALDKDQVDSKVMKNEKILKPTKRSKKFWSPGGLLAGICILTGKKIRKDRKSYISFSFSIHHLVLDKKCQETKQ